MVRMMLVLKTFLNPRVAAVNNDLVARGVGRGKKRKTHNVVPVSVADQQVNYALSLPTRTLHEVDTKLTNAGAGVKYNLSILALNFHARSVATGGSSLMIGEGFDVILYRSGIIQV
jgi:hypothetical protein